uniref:Putative ovule protein n=1 Tax=Solanum chacoense TaxID=4108 RepID=A0A0V0GYC8_SOLCH
MWAPCSVKSSFKWGVWSTISNLMNQYNQFVKLKLGNVNNVQLLSDVWLGSESFRSKFFVWYCCSTNKMKGI